MFPFFSVFREVSKFRVSGISINSISNLDDDEGAERLQNYFETDVLVPII